MRNSMKYLIGFFALIFSLGLFLQPVNVQANEPACECFCKTTAGANSIGSSTLGQCNIQCAENAKGMAVCAYDSTQHPKRNSKCWDPKNDTEQCDKRGGTISKEQQQECPKGWGYCLTDPTKANIKTNLTTQITGRTSVSTIGEYIDLVYRYLMGASILIAVVLTMISGMQYAIARSQEDISKAKERIKKALIGTVILISAALILRTVNPQLIKLTLPPLPIIKEVQFIFPGSTCEAFTDKDTGTVNFEDLECGDEENPRPCTEEDKKCGVEARIVKLKDGSAADAGATCTFTSCNELSIISSGPGQTPHQSIAQCVFDPKGVGQCLSCAQAVPLQVAKTKSGIIPSAAVCSQLQRPNETAGLQNQIQVENHCFYTNDPVMVYNDVDIAANIVNASAGVIGAGVSGGNIAVGGVVAGLSASVFGGTDPKLMVAGTCAELQVDCKKKVRTCEAYTELEAFNEITDGDLDNLSGKPLGSDITLKKICENDPCRALRDDVLQGSCVFVDNPGFGDDRCITKKVHDKEVFEEQREKEIDQQRQQNREQQEQRGIAPISDRL